MMLRRNGLTKKTILYVLIFILFYANTGFSVFASVTSSAPNVNAGADKTVTLPAEIALTGTASGAISTTWSLQSGPAVTNLDILAPNALNTIAMVTYPGIYVFKLTGTNASGSASDTIRIVVNPSVVSTPPSWVSANGFYKKCIVINGIPIVSTDAVADQALINSSYVLDAQLRKIKLTKPAVLQKLVSNRAYVMIVGLNENNNMHPSWSNYNDASWPRRGGGGLNCTILEEDCVVPANDTWRRNFSGQIHEFAHTLLTYGIGDIRGLGAEPQAYPAILAAYNNAVAAGKYSNSSYDVSNYHEYFTGQSCRWFNANPTNLLVPNASTKTDRQQLQEYDIEIYNILSEYYGDYTLPAPWGPEVTVMVDKNVLTDLIADAKVLSEVTFTPESWSVFAAALFAAETVSGSETAVQADVDAAVASLQGAMGALVIKPTDNKIKIDLQTEDQVTILNPVTFIISLANMKNVMTTSFTFEVDGDMLESTGLEALNAFTAMSGANGTIKWTKIPETSRWKGEVTLMFLADPENGITSVNGVNVLKLMFAAKDLGQTTMTLTGAKISGLDEEGEVAFLDWEAIHTEATTNIVKHYSIYDLNQDEVVDQLDLTIAQRSYQKQQGEAGWGAAAKADVTGDGTVDMLDLILIFVNYSE